MQVESERQGAVTVLRPRGPLIAEDAEVVRHKGGEAIADSLGRLVIDASAIVYVDSKGIEALLDLADELSDAGQVLKLSGTNGKGDILAASPCQPQRRCNRCEALLRCLPAFVA